MEDITRRDLWIGSGAYSGSFLRTQAPTGIIISPGIAISTETGKVTLPEGMTLDEASKAFWKAVEAYFPILKERCEQR